jgi:hypothetical protein
MNLAKLQKYRKINYFGLGLSFVLALSQIYFIPYLTISNSWLLILFLTFFFINLFYLFCFTHLINLILDYKEKNSDSYKRLNAIKYFRKKHGEKLSEKYGNDRLEDISTNLDNPKAHSNREIQEFITSCLQETVREMEDSRNNECKVDLWAIAFTCYVILCLVIIIELLFNQYGFSLVKIFNFLGVFGEVFGGALIGCLVLFFNKLGTILFSKISPIEKTLRSWLAEYEAALKQEYAKEKLGFLKNIKKIFREFFENGRKRDRRK